jgi:hypothetical protein
MRFICGFFQVAAKNIILVYKKNDIQFYVLHNPVYVKETN